MKPKISLSRALTDLGLFGGTFIAPSFWTWRTVAKLIDGVPLTEQREVDLFKQCTGRSTLPTKRVRRLIIGLPQTRLHVSDVQEVARQQ